MEWRKISSGVFPSIAYETQECRGQYLHRVKILGPVAQKERIPFFKAALSVTKSENFFMLVDNRVGHENDLTAENMAFLADLLIEGGIRRFYNAIVTPDEGYRGIAKLIEAISDTRQVIKSETLTTYDYAEAEKFIMSRMEKFMDPE